MGQFGFGSGHFGKITTVEENLGRVSSGSESILFLVWVKVTGQSGWLSDLLGLVVAAD